MIKFRSYLTVQLKRTGRLFPFVIGMTLLFAAVVFLLALTLKSTQGASEYMQTVTIGVTGETDDPYLRLGMAGFLRMDAGRYIIDLRLLTEEEAGKQLQAGKLSGYVVIPEDFVNRVNRGETVELLYAAGNDTSAVGSILMDEIVGRLEEIVSESQKAINGIWRLMGNYVGNGDPDALTDKVFLTLVDTILNRCFFYELTLCGWGEQLSLTAYFVVGISLFFMLLWGIIGSSLLVRRESAMPALLQAGGFGCFWQILAEYLSYLLLMLGNFGIIFLPAGVLLQRMGISVREWEGMSRLEPVLFFLRLIPVILLFAAMQFLLYEVISDMVSGILLQFLVGLCLGFLSGCLYPLSFLPEGIRRLSLLLPTGAAMRYGAGCMRGRILWSELGIMGMFFLLFFAMAVWARKRRMMS